MGGVRYPIVYAGKAEERRNGGRRKRRKWNRELIDEQNHLYKVSIINELGLSGVSICDDDMVTIGKLFILIRYGADVFAITKQGDTAAHLAMKHGWNEYGV